MHGPPNAPPFHSRNAGGALQSSGADAAPLMMAHSRAETINEHSCPADLPQCTGGGRGRGAVTPSNLPTLRRRNTRLNLDTPPKRGPISAFRLSPFLSTGSDSVHLPGQEHWALTKVERRISRCRLDLKVWGERWAWLPCRIYSQLSCVNPYPSPTGTPTRSNPTHLENAV